MAVLQFRFRSAAVWSRREVSGLPAEPEQLVNVTLGYLKQGGDFFDCEVMLIDCVDDTLAEF